MEVESDLMSSRYDKMILGDEILHVISTKGNAPLRYGTSAATQLSRRNENPK